MYVRCCMKRSKEAKTEKKSNIEADFYSKIHNTYNIYNNFVMLNYD